MIAYPPGIFGVGSNQIPLRVKFAPGEVGAILRSARTGIRIMPGIFYLSGKNRHFSRNNAGFSRSYCYFLQGNAYSLRGNLHSLPVYFFRHKWHFCRHYFNICIQKSDLRLQKNRSCSFFMLHFFAFYALCGQQDCTRSAKSILPIKDN